MHTYQLESGALSQEAWTETRLIGKAKHLRNEIDTQRHLLYGLELMS